MELQDQGDQAIHPLTAELIRVCRSFSAFEREAICCGDVTVSQCVVLQALLPEPLDLSSLAAFAGGSPSAMTRLVDGLERRGWVERVRSRDDRRRVTIELTRSGREEALRLRSLTDDAIRQVLSHIPADRRDAVMEAVRLVGRAMERAKAEGLVCCLG
jgi:DNA-binding MarR family transcriptional regulator